MSNIEVAFALRAILSYIPRRLLRETCPLLQRTLCSLSVSAL